MYQLTCGISVAWQTCCGSHFDLKWKKAECATPFLLAYFRLWAQDERDFFVDKEEISESNFGVCPDWWIGGEPGEDDWSWDHWTGSCACTGDPSYSIRWGWKRIWSSSRWPTTCSSPTRRRFSGWRMWIGWRSRSSSRRFGTTTRWRDYDYGGCLHCSGCEWSRSAEWRWRCSSDTWVWQCWWDGVAWRSDFRFTSELWSSSVYAGVEALVWLWAAKEVPRAVWVSTWCLWKGGRGCRESSGVSSWGGGATTSTCRITRSKEESEWGSVATTIEGATTKGKRASVGAGERRLRSRSRLKEELQALKIRKEEVEKKTPAREEFNTPENIPVERLDQTTTGMGPRRLDMSQGVSGGDPTMGLHHNVSGGDPTMGLHHNASGGDPTAGDTMKFMMTMLESMQQLIKERESGRGGSDVEQVKTTVDLPRLPEWNHETGPIDLGDWLATIDPFMEDLSDTAEVWWKLLRKEAMVWYEEHMALSPLDRLTHEIKPSKELANPKWSRLERRAAGLLMAAVPTPIREEVVSTRSVTAMGILTRLCTVYQPGGLAEKALILTSLESPKEESTIVGAVQSLRRWIRWRRRASDVGVSMPDPTVLMRGLTRLTKRVMSANPELAFRVSLARNTLLVDSIPNHTTVSQLADHILAELEQVQHQDRKQRDAAGGDPAKAKEVKMLDQMSEMGGKAKGKGKDKGYGKGDKGERGDLPAASGEQRCKFFLTDQGCRKGKECTWAHISDGKRRCYNCGSTEHLAPDCTRRSTMSSTSPTRPKAAKAVEDKPKDEEASVSSEGTSAGGSGEVMQQLLSEANKMLKTLSTKEKPVTVSHDERMKALQEQLDELKTKALKTLKLTRITRGGVSGLLDSGATHPMRAARRGEPVHSYKKVEVTLASGKTEELKISPKGVMVLDGKDSEYVEPIVPMGMLVTRLCCQLHWNDQGLHVWHPKRGYIDVTVHNGCPQIPKALALKLIQELEQAEGDLLQYHSKGLSWETRLQERAWLRSLVNSHPVFEGLPEALKDKLVVTPEEDVKSLPANRRARKIWKRDGCVLHLYAGEASGYTFARAFREAGGREKHVLEIDIKRGEIHDMRRTSCYGSLMRLALDGQISALVGGPNCRTRSVLRTYDGGPPPVRSWDGGEFGIPNASEAEIEKVQHDDEMMWKMILLYLVAKASRRALRKDEGLREPVGFLLEQPAAPEYKPEVVSFWWTRQWRSLQQLESLELYTVNQGDYGGDAVKPTGLGTNLEVAEGRLRGKGRARPADGSGDSSSLARWAPGLMKAVAVSVMNFLGMQPCLKAINW